MTKPVTLRGSQVLVMLGNGASPETFAAPCGITTKSLNMAASANEFNVPDCDDPDLPMWTERVVNALSAGIAGNGVLAMDSLDEWRDWFLSGSSKKVHVSLEGNLAAGGGYFAMSAVLTTMNIGANQGELATIQVEIQSDGEVTWVPAGT